MKRMMGLMVLVGLICPRAYAGGGPANVLVIYNADEPAAVDVVDHYATERSIPPGQLCGLTGIDPTTRDLAFADYVTQILEPVVDCLEGLPQPEEIDYLVTIRGLPYRIVLEDNGFYTSLSAMLQVLEAASTGDGSLLAGTPQLYGDYHQASIDNPAYVGGWCQGGDLVVENPYSGWYEAACGITRETDHPDSFRSADASITGGYDFAGNLFIVTRLDGFDFDDATDLVDRAVAGDGTFPTADIMCMEGADSARAARDPECEFVTRQLEAAGLPGLWYSPFEYDLAGMNVAAYFTGTSDLRGAIAGNTYVPGAITCNLTSTGAAPSNFFCNEAGDVCPESESQTSIARFVRAGATGTHGTVAEPLNNTFPNAGALLHYTFGYNLGESYFFNQRYIYWQNLVLGDPLATPYGERPVVTFGSSGDVPQGSDLIVTASHTDGVAEIRLYQDGALIHAQSGGELAYTVEDDQDTTAEMLAIAIADNVEVDRPGWPLEVHEPHADVQGWSTLLMTVVEPLPADDDDDDDDNDDDDDESGMDDDDSDCSCRHAGARRSGGLWLLMLLTALCLRRKIGDNPQPRR